MAATFHDNLDRPLDRLRLSLGDTNVAAALLQDDTIEATLAHYGNDEQRALLELARALIARWAQEPTRLQLTGTNGSEAEWKDRLAGWQAIVTRLQALYVVGTPSAGLRIVRAAREGDAPRSEYRGDGGRVPW